jgi:hypothetical protein
MGPYSILAKILLERRMALSVGTKSTGLATAGSEELCMSEFLLNLEVSQVTWVRLLMRGDELLQMRCTGR